MAELGDLIKNLDATRPKLSFPEGGMAEAHLAQYRENWPETLMVNTPCLALFLSPTLDQAIIQAVQNDSADLTQLCRETPCDLRLYEMAEHEERSDNTQLQAISYGMMAVDETMDCVVLGGGQADDIAKANCLNSFMSRASAPQAGLFGAMIAAIQAGLPTLITGAMVHDNVRLLSRLAPNATSWLVDVDALNWTPPQLAESLPEGPEPGLAMRAIQAVQILKHQATMTTPKTAHPAE